MLIFQIIARWCLLMDSISKVIKIDVWCVPACGERWELYSSLLTLSYNPLLHIPAQVQNPERVTKKGNNE